MERRTLWITIGVILVLLLLLFGAVRAFADTPQTNYFATLPHAPVGAISAQESVVREWPDSLKAPSQSASYTETSYGHSWYGESSSWSESSGESGESSWSAQTGSGTVISKNRVILDPSSMRFNGRCGRKTLPAIMADSMDTQLDVGLPGVTLPGLIWGDCPFTASMLRVETGSGSPFGSLNF